MAVMCIGGAQLEIHVKEKKLLQRQGGAICEDGKADTDIRRRGNRRGRRILCYLKRKVPCSCDVPALTATQQEVQFFENKWVTRTAGVKRTHNTSVQELIKAVGKESRYPEIGRSKEARKTEIAMGGL